MNKTDVPRVRIDKAGKLDVEDEHMPMLNSKGDQSQIVKTSANETSMVKKTKEASHQHSISRLGELTHNDKNVKRVLVIEIKGQLGTLLE